MTIPTLCVSRFTVRCLVYFVQTCSAWENGCSASNKCAPGLVCYNEGKSWAQCRPDVARTCGLPDINDGCRGSGAKYSTCCAGSICDPDAGPHYASCVIVDERGEDDSGGCSGEKFCGKGTSWYGGKCVLDSMTTKVPTTQKPTTQKPTTQKPTTQKPTTQKPTTQKPITQKPTTAPSCGTRAANVDNAGFAAKHGKLRLDGLQLVDKNGDGAFCTGYRLVEDSQPLTLPLRIHSRATYGNVQSWSPLV